ncbi:MAG: hypothetical protein F6K17_11995 [Okeania sp. SIO3C4]|nr:hypothetical protein [Okeania sp. SIO3B3]NER03283.1 hypothetical protein [Okeania sp. SIO3C4]
MNTYTLEKVRQKALMLEAEGKKRLEEKSFFITDYPDMILLSSWEITISSLLKKFCGLISLIYGHFIC